MPFLIYQLKLAAAFLLLYIFFRIFLAKEPLHAFNRIAVLLSIVIAAVLPACVITFHVEAAPLTAAVFSAGPVEPSSDGPGFDWVSLLLAVYIVGAAAVLLSGIASDISLMRLISRGERLRQSDGTVVVLVDEPVAPMSWMKFIILSREDYSSDPEAIMVHEKAHIRLGHSVDVLLADLFTALQWFNPAAWMMRDDLRAIHEYQADEEVVKSGIDVKQYQLLLVKKAFGANGRSVSNNFNHGELKKRITMMSMKKSSAFKALKFLYVLPLVCAGLAANARPVYGVPEKVVESYTLNGDISVEVAGDSASVANFLPDNVKIYIDGKLVTNEEMQAFDPEKIASVNVIKNGEESAIHIYTEDTQAPEGSQSKLHVKIQTSDDPGLTGNGQENGLKGKPMSVMIAREGYSGTIDISMLDDAQLGDSKEGLSLKMEEVPDFYVDGKKVGYDTFREMPPEDIESIVVSKPDGPDGKGRIDVTTKKK